MEWKLDSKPEESDGRGGWRGETPRGQMGGKRRRREEHREVRRDDKGGGGRGGGKSSSEPSVSWVTDPEVQNTSAHVGSLKCFYYFCWPLFIQVSLQLYIKQSSYCQDNNKLEEPVQFLQGPVHFTSSSLIITPIDLINNTCLHFVHQKQLFMQSL